MAEPDTRRATAQGIINSLTADGYDVALRGGELCVSATARSEAKAADAVKADAPQASAEPAEASPAADAERASDAGEPAPAPKRRTTKKTAGTKRAAKSEE